MWSVVCAPYLAASVLLVAAGLPKLADPLPLVRALRSAGLPSAGVLVRVAALAEVGIGATAIAVPGRLAAALVCIAYLIFTAFVILVLRRGGVLASCGCFGRADTPAARTHLVLTSALALTAGVAALAPPPPGVWRALPPALLATTAGYAALLALLAYLVLAVLPRVSATAITSTARRVATADPRKG